ncbi:MAG: hypothetical protein JST59_17185, partial [Actinobacteria bacterium]|nr:hypothetical protein [Actinomycetota bacterium]
AEYFDVRGRAAGNLKFIKKCEEVGGDCEVVDELPFLVSELGTELPSKVASAAQANPDFNILWAGYDDALIFALQGLQQAGISGKEGAGFDANAASIERINNGEELATMGLPGTWIGFGLIDDLNRMFAGQEPVIENIHTKLLYKGNVQDIGKGEGWNGDINVIPLYEKLWGVS